jgi:hypothetical protein
LFGEFAEVVVERLTRANVVAHLRVARRTRGQLALLEHQREQRVQRMPWKEQTKTKIEIFCLEAHNKKNQMLKLTKSI